MTPDIEAKKGRIQMAIEANKGMVEYANTFFDIRLHFYGFAMKAKAILGSSDD